MTKTELMQKVRAGREVMAKAKPPMTRAAYFEFQRRVSRREVYEG